MKSLLVTFVTFSTFHSVNLKIPEIFYHHLSLSFHSSQISVGRVLKCYLCIYFSSVSCQHCTTEKYYTVMHMCSHMAYVTFLLNCSCLKIPFVETTIEYESNPAMPDCVTDFCAHRGTFAVSGRSCVCVSSGMSCSRSQTDTEVQSQVNVLFSDP